MRHLFRKHLLKQISEWRDNGDRLILLVDGNENLAKDHLGSALRSSLNMVDLVEERTNMPGPATHKEGSKQIDGAFATRDIECTGARFLSLRDGHGDRRAVVIDITYRSLVGREKLLIEKPQSQRLQFSIPSSVKKYNRALLLALTDCDFYDRLRTVYSKVAYPVGWHFRRQRRNSISYESNVCEARKQNVVRSKWGKSNTHRRCRSWRWLRRSFGASSFAF